MILSELDLVLLWVHHTKKIWNNLKVLLIHYQKIFLIRYKLFFVVMI